MKNKHLLFLIFSIIIVESCTFSSKKNAESSFENICSDTLTKGERIDSVLLKIFKIDSIFFKQLDTIILEEKKCPYYNKCNSGFLFTSSLLKSESGLKEIMISAININRYNYSKCKCIFEYKEHRFVCDSLSNTNFLQQTNDSQFVKYIVKDKPQGIHDIDDRFSNWLFININNRIICTGHYQCIDAKN
jgi:hypothetical protein